eukprot:5076331-Amphidinium_carterae.1
MFELPGVTDDELPLFVGEEDYAAKGAKGSELLHHGITDYEPGDIFEDDLDFNAYACSLRSQCFPLRVELRMSLIAALGPLDPY